MVLPPYAAWRKIIGGNCATILGIGPVISKLIEAVRHFDDAKRPNIWVVSELPIETLPDEFLQDVRRGNHLIVVEEHVAHGGVGEMLSRALLLYGKAPERFSHRCAQGYPSERYGSQNFHRRECGLDAASIIADLFS